jgi:dextranase
MKHRMLISLLAIVLMIAATAAQAGPLINSVWTDKAQYRTWQNVNVYVKIKNTTGSTWSGNVGVYPRHLGINLSKDQHKYVSLANNATQTLTYTFSMNSANDRGYLAEIWCWKDGGGATDMGSTSFDFSGDWRKFPRYGYLTQFHDNVSASALIDPMRQYKINAIQYYDWADSHHIQYISGFQYWQDIAARSPWVSKVKLNELINRGHGYNMSAMAYQLMFGAYDNYWNEGVQISWGAFTSWKSGQYDPSDQDRHELSIAGWETARIYLFNPASQGWRDWMADEFQIVFNNFGFDGWHIDTLGDRGTLYDWNKNSFSLDNTYAGFVNDMRNQLGSKHLVVNTVSNYGEWQIAQNSSADIVYSELWTESDEDDFYDLSVILNNIQNQTSKSAVIAGYMNYDRAKSYSDSSPGQFKEASILLADAAIFASGGWHIELGDGTNLLSNEYFPSRKLVMPTTLKAKLLNYYDFAVAYENLLRDNVWDGNKRVDYDLGGSIPSGYDATANRVWKMAKWRNGYGGVNYYDIAHLINLRSCSHTKWRDPAGNFNPPTEITNKKVRLYYDNDWGASRVWYASPDYDGGKANEVTSYTRAYDSGEGKWYVEFTLPRLKYWTMVWLERHS